jgi:hypothetical protein
MERSEEMGKQEEEGCIMSYSRESGNSYSLS